MRDRAIRFTVNATLAVGCLTNPLEYSVKHCGKPSFDGLAKFVKAYNESGQGIEITSAKLLDNGNEVAFWAAIPA